MTQKAQKIQGRFYLLTSEIGRLTTIHQTPPSQSDIEVTGLPFNVTVTGEEVENV